MQLGGAETGTPLPPSPSLGRARALAPLHPSQRHAGMYASAAELSGSKWNRPCNPPLHPLSQGPRCFPCDYLDSPFLIHLFPRLFVYPPESLPPWPLGLPVVVACSGLFRPPPPPVPNRAWVSATGSRGSSRPALTLQDLLSFCSLEVTGEPFGA